MNINNTATFRPVMFLASISALRIIGLAMILPLFSLYASALPHATPALVGMAMGSYGLTQALLQIPLGTLSDYFGRKPIIALGLVIFMLGSLVIAFASSIFGVTVGRALQGAGAISSALLAMVADFTKERERTKAMTIMGIAVGGAFTLAMVLGPVLGAWLSVPSLCNLSAGFAGIALLLLWLAVPTPSPSARTNLAPATPAATSFWAVQVQLWRLNLGVFVLHVVLIANFLVIPLLLHNQLNLASAQQWQLYLPALLIGALLAFYGIAQVEKKQRTRVAFLCAIVLLFFLEVLAALLFQTILGGIMMLTGFFASFAFLEANLPAIISKIVPAERKGMAMGLYATNQFLGIFVGGVLGGWLLGQFAEIGVFLANALLVAIWLIISLKIKQFN